MTVATDPLLASALDYAARGWPVLRVWPVTSAGGCQCPKRGQCKSPGKHPVGEAWQKNATTDTNQVHRLWDERPDYNVGVTLGPGSGIIDVECDSEEAEQELAKYLGDDPPVVPTFMGNRGKHRLFKYRDGLPAKAVVWIKAGAVSDDKAAGAIEVRIGNGGKGAQSVFPSSKHAKGTEYRWLVHPDETEPGQLPESLVRALANSAPRNGKAPPLASKITEPGRNDALCSLAGSMRRRGASQEAIEAALQAENLLRCDPPLDADEVRKIARSVAQYPPAGVSGGKLPQENGDHLEADDDPHRLAHLFLLKFVSEDGLRLRYWQCEWYSHSGTAYRKIDDGELKARIVERIKAEFDRTAKLKLENWKASDKEDKGPPPTAQKVTKQVIGNVVQALASLCVLPSRIDMPAWADTPAWVKCKAFEPAHPANEILACKNLLLHLPSMQAHPHTCRFWSPNALDYDFDRHAKEPIRWLAFLNSLWPDDQEAIDALQEWFGYCLLPDTSQQKILMIVGPKRSGKGTIARVLRALIGIENTAAPTLASLGTNFGLYPLVGKLLATISDARLSGRTDVAQVAERLLSISGEDPQTIDRKHMPAITVKLLARFVILTNELPKLADPSGALVSRMIVLRQTRSFYGKEDTHLTDNLLAELPAILAWAIVGWYRLDARGYFVQPQSARRIISDLEDLSSPIGAFLRECCEIEPAHEVFVRDLFAAWQKWCEAKGRKESGNEQTFGRDLRAALPTVETRQPRSEEGRVRVYIGLRLRQEWD